MSGRLARLLVSLLLCGSAAGAQEVSPARIEAGQSLPALSGVDLEGSPLQLEASPEGPILVLSFWSIHCGDCIRELDDLRAIRREFPADDVRVVAVNTDSGLPVSRVAGFVRRYEASRGELGLTHLLDRDGVIVSALGIRYIPLLIVVDRSGRVSSVLTGYQPSDRPRVAQAMEEGRLALGAWSEGLRGRLRTVLRGPAPGGGSIEWGTFRVEDGMSLFGLYDASGFLADAGGRRDRAMEVARVESVLAERLKVLLLWEALASLDVRLAAPSERPFGPGGIQVPESPLAESPAWKRLYEGLRFDELYRVEDSSRVWVGDELWAGLVGDVDLGRLRERLVALGFPKEPARLRVEIVSDFDYKPRAVLQRFRRASYRLQAVQGEYVVYYGDAESFARELSGIEGVPFKLFVEVLTPETVRVEVF
jgi:thiol-disulfide isomerase/thioredoxin